MLKRQEIMQCAYTALAHGNPYIKRAVKFYEGQVVKYIYADKVYTENELNDAYIETAMKDIKYGYDERMVGYYDKWYRYNRADEGRAYDIGVRRATEEEKCVGEMRIIECMA